MARSWAARSKPAITANSAAPTFSQRSSPLLEGLAEAGSEPVWMSHGDKIDRDSRRFLAWWRRRESSPFAVIADEKRRFYGVQFHPEVAHTPRGAALSWPISCATSPASRREWNMHAFRAAAIEKIRKQVGKGRVICGLSGGVDSSVAAVLIHEAIGDQLTCIFVDTGLMRAGEADEVVSLFRDHYNIPLIHAEAARPVPGAAGGRQRSGTKAQDHRRRLHRRLRQGKPEGRRRGISGPGHALSRRDRKRLGHRRALRHHQVASQCRRLARAI